MQVFVSWSGERSRLIAEAVRSWLPKVVKSVNPWMSTEDIGAGARWLSEVSATLNAATVGLICVTPENQHNPWLLFEAGALSKTLDQTCVCPLLLEMTPGQLNGPLTQFQANSLNRDGIAKVLSTINKGLGESRLDPQQLEEILDVWWPKLEERIKAIPAPKEPTAARSIDDQLEEILQLARENLRRENLRLEASMERDEKLDSMVGFVEQAGQMMGAMQSHAQRLQSSLGKRIDSAHGGASIEHQDVTSAIAGTMTDGPLSGASMVEIAETLRGLHERDKARTESMLASVPTGKVSDAV
jgi:hypothetical protein